MDLNKILKSDYLDILFEGRNKAYGGYELRRNYPQRVRNSLFIIGGLFALVMGYTAYANMHKTVKQKPVISMTTVTLAEPPPMEPNKPKPPPPPPAPPPPAKPTVKFTPPVIKKDEQVKEEEKPTPPDPTKHEQSGPTTQAGDVNGSDLAPPTTAPTGNGAPVEQPKTDQIFKYVEQQPAFKGDLGGWLKDHLEYPDAAREAGNEGKTYVQFVVSEDGSISAATVVKSSGFPALDAEALRVVRMMPKWTPGRNNNQPVKVYFTQPIGFTLE